MKQVILHNIRSAHNVGSIFRTADGAGVSKILCTGYTPTPTDRFGRTQSEIQKTSLGASETMPWEHIADVYHAIDTARTNGLQVCSVEQTDRAINLSSFTVPESVIYIFGNEVSGVPEDVCAASDAVVYIPMLGTKESLNVSVAAGIVLFH